MSQTTNKKSVPTHLGLILDGNRRWAKAQGMPTLEGHRAGYKNLKTIGLAALERGVQYVSAYVFSTENWKRSEDEVAYLMDLLVWVATHEVEELNKKNVRVRFVGTRVGLSDKVLKAVYAAEAKTAGNDGGTLALCLNYGGQVEIADAVRAIINEDIPADEVTPELIEKHLYAPDIPAIDLVIRTSGEQRISNFMLWRIAYSEMYFVHDKHWPAFTVADLDKAFADYAGRERRFGGGK